MYKYAQILWNKVHWIFETAETLEELYQRFAPDMVFIEITGSSKIHEGWKYENGEFIEPALPEPTPEEIQTALTAAVQTHMDTKAQERGYDTIHTASNYAGSNHPKYGSEGRACLDWMCTVWDICYNILNEVTAGQREIPTTEELIAELPKMVWPET